MEVQHGAPGGDWLVSNMGPFFTLATLFGCMIFFCPDAIVTRMTMHIQNPVLSKGILIMDYYKPHKKWDV